MIVEDGSGLPDANSYGSLDEANAYFVNLGNQNWDVTANALNENALINATQSLDLLYGSSYSSTKLTGSQALKFPRYGFEDKDGIYRDAGVIPVEIKKALFELAISYQSGADLVPNSDPANNIIKQTVKLDVLEKTTEYSGTTNSSVNRKVKLILDPILNGSSASIGSLRLVRA